MTIGSAVKQGLSIARRSGTAVWVLFLANLALAALAAWPIYHGILDFTGQSLMSRTLLRGFSTDWFTDFSLAHPGAWQSYAFTIANVGLLAIVVNSLLAGGVLAHFRTPELPQGPVTFFRDAGRYSWRMIRLMFVGLIGYWLVFLATTQGLERLVRHWKTEALDDRPVFWLNLGISLLMLLGLVFVNMVMDYARVMLVWNEETSAVAAFLASLGFTLGRFRKVLTVYAIPSLLGIALLLLYRGITPWTQIQSSLGAPAWSHLHQPVVLTLLFLGQQIIMWGRYWFRVATWASEWSYRAGSST